MVTSDQEKAIQEPLQELVSAFEIDILNAIAKAMLDVPSLSATDINLRSMRLRQELNAIRLRHMEKIQQAAKDALIDTFMLGAIQEPDGRFNTK